MRLTSFFIILARISQWLSEPFVQTQGHPLGAAVALHRVVRRKKLLGNPGWLDTAYRRTRRSGFWVVWIQELPVGAQAAERSSFSTRSASNANSSSFAVL